MADTSTLVVTVTKSMRERIDAVAKAEDIPMAQVVRDILEGGITRRERVSETRTLR